MSQPCIWRLEPCRSGLIIADNIADDDRTKCYSGLAPVKRHSLWVMSVILAKGFLAILWVSVPPSRSFLRNVN